MYADLCFRTESFDRLVALSATATTDRLVAKSTGWIGLSPYVGPRRSGWRPIRWTLYTRSVKQLTLNLDLLVIGGSLTFCRFSKSADPMVAIIKWYDEYGAVDNKPTNTPPSA